MTAITPTPVVIRQDHTAIDQRPRTGDKQEKPRYGLAPVLDDASEDESEAGIESDVVTVEYRSKAAVLPIEILGHVFAHLAPADLDNAALVCRHWYRAADDASWRASFARHFAVTKFNRVTPSLKWRTEFMTRLDYLHKWRKGHCTNLSFNAAVWDISNVFSDFEASRILALNLNRGIAVVADPTRGKVANQRVFTDKSLQPSADAISVDGGRHGIVWGLIGGRVMLVLFSHETRLRDYMTLKGFHFDNTTAVWINKLEAPRTTARIPVLSGGSDGHVFVWNVKTGLIEKDLTAIPDVPIVRIKGDSRERFVCLNARGDVFAFDRTKDEELRRIASIPLGGGSVIHFEVDFVSGYAIIAIASGVYRVFIDGDALPAADDPAVPSGAASTASATASAGVSPVLEPVPEHTESELPRAGAQRIPSGVSTEGPVVRFSTAPDPLGKIVAASVDATAFPASRVGTDTPGSNVRYVAAATDRNLVYVWDLEHAASPEHNNEIPALRVQDSPFEVRDEGADPQSAAAPLPAVTAVALNSLVLLLGSYNGVTVALDLLTGDFLRVVSARFSKRALDFRAAGGPGRLWPVTHLELDPDPASPHGIIVVRSAIQYFDLGAEHNRSTIKKKGVQKRPAAYTGGAVQTGSSSRGQIEQDIEQELRMMDESDDEEGEDDEDLLRVRRERNARQFFSDMTEEEQLRYAMILSRGEENSQGESEAEDPEIRRVLELSAPQPGASAPLPPSGDIDLSRLTEEQQFEYALRLSQQEPQTEEQALEMALKLSEQEPQTEEQALEMALKLSQQQEQEKAARGRAPDPEPAAEDDLDEEMKLALRLSLQES